MSENQVKESRRHSMFVNPVKKNYTETRKGSMLDKSHLQDESLNVAEQAKNLFELRKLEFSKQKEKEEELKRQAFESVWCDNYEANIIETMECNLAFEKVDTFQHIFSWDRLLLQQKLHHNLTALRISQYPIIEVPENVPDVFSTLKSFSFISTSLTKVPEKIGGLKNLTELILTKNEIEILPESLGDLVLLRHLDLSCNKLVRLPTNIGNLKLLESFLGEKNCLVALPQSFGRLNCKSVHLNMNKLAVLPSTIGNLQHTTYLSLNANMLTALPEEIGSMPSIEKLLICNNALAELPESIGNLRTLCHLRLDWNKIRELPFSFRFLNQDCFTLLMMEQNPLRIPSKEVLASGVRSVVACMENEYQKSIIERQRQVLQDLQFALKALAEYYIVKKKNFVSGVEKAVHLALSQASFPNFQAYFEPNFQVVVGKASKLDFFTMVDGSLWTVLIPAVELIWRIESLSNNLARAPRKFHHTREEVNDALANYKDNYGTVVHEEMAYFRKCECTDENGKKHKCSVSAEVQMEKKTMYRCHRKAFYIRMSLVTSQEYQEQQANAYLEHRVTKFVTKSREKAEAFLASEDGCAFMLQEATNASNEYMNFVRNKLQSEKQAILDARNNEKLLEKHQKMRDKLLKEREKSDKKLKAAIAKMEASSKQLSSRKNSDKYANKIAATNVKIQAFTKELRKPKDEKLIEVEALIEKFNKGTINQIAADVESDSEFSSDENSDSSSGSDSSGDSESTDSESENEQQRKKRSEYERQLPPLEEAVEYHEAARLKIELELGWKIVPVEALIPIYEEHLRDAYMTEKITRVKNKIIREFTHMRVAMKSWLGIGIRTIFEAWKEETRKNIIQTRKNAIAQKNARKLAKDGRMAARELGKFEAKKWEQKQDEFSDKFYYQHIETGEIQWNPPRYWRRATTVENLQ